MGVLGAGPGPAGDGGRREARLGWVGPPEGRAVRAGNAQEGVPYGTARRATGGLEIGAERAGLCLPPDG
jgi:hypothetical protein